MCVLSLHNSTQNAHEGNQAQHRKCNTEPVGSERKVAARAVENLLRQVASHHTKPIMKGKPLENSLTMVRSR